MSENESTTVMRIIEFDAGHRVMKHESKCRTLHGHRYKLEIYARARNLDDIGRVIDFGVIKDKVKGWIDKEWDHNCIVSHEDIEVIKALRSIPRAKEVYIMEGNPTAENMARHLLDDVMPYLFDDTEVEVFKVRLWETPNCYAEVQSEE